MFLFNIFNNLFIIKGKCIFLNEFIHGGSISFHLKKMKQFPETYVKFYSAQIVSAMAYLYTDHSILL